MDNNRSINSSDFVKISNMLADYKFLLNTSTKLQSKSKELLLFTTLYLM